MYFLSGLLIANGFPHFIKGVAGEKHQTPFGQPSDAVTNVVWGSLNFVLAWALWHYAGLYRDLTHTFRYEVVFGLGIFLMAVLLAKVWSQSNKAK